MHRLQLLFVMAVCLAVSAVAGRADESADRFVGKFVGDKLTVQIGGAGPLSGTIAMGAQTFPLTAHLDGGKLVGSFRSGGNDFPFTATLEGNDLTLVSGGVSYAMKRAAVNPLAMPQPAAGTNPPAASGAGREAGQAGSGHEAGQAAPGGELLELAATEHGKTLFLKLPQATSMDAAVQGAGDALGKALDEKPIFTQASVDARSHGKGLASFTDKAGGQEVKGLMLFTIDAHDGATVTILYTAAGASGEETAKLMAALPMQQKMQTHEFPDGSGSVDLPPGWTTASQSLTAGAVFIAGPKDQTVVYNGTILVNTPNSRTMQLYQRNVQMSRQLRMPAPPPPPGVISDRCSPREVVEKVLPQINEQSRQAGRPWNEFTRVIDSVEVPANPFIAGAQAGKFYIAYVAHQPTGDKPMRQWVRIDTWDVGDGKDVWTIGVNGMYGPEATFETDLPVMQQIFASMKLAPGAMERQGAANQAQFKQFMENNQRQHEAMLARGREFNRQQQDRFERFESNMRAQSQARHDANSDFIEMIRGYRDVYDTRTGTMHSVDYYNVDAITNSWNAAANDPHQFVQAPLRYQR